MVATADLWVYDAENLCVSFFYQVTSVFHLRGGKIKKRVFFGPTYSAPFGTGDATKTDEFSEKFQTANILSQQSRPTHELISGNTRVPTFLSLSLKMAPLCIMLEDHES